MRKTFPIAVAIACGFLVLIDFFVSHPIIDALGATLVEGTIVLAAFAMLLGVLNLLSVHAQRIAGGERGRGLSLVLIGALVATLAVGVTLPGSTTLAWIFDYIYYPLQSTMAALLAFFAVSAAYRAFRLRNTQAAIMLVTSLVVLVAQLPFSQAISPYLPVARDWIFTFPVTAGMRGIVLGTTLGTIATSLRILFAVDRPYA